MAPCWLPPLNFHRLYEVSVKASDEAECDPAVFDDEFWVQTKVGVRFRSDKEDSNQRIFEGLSFERACWLFCNEIEPGLKTSSARISLMLDRTFIPFELQGALWKWKERDTDEWRNGCVLSGDVQLIEKIEEFLYCMKKDKCNMDNNKLTLFLEIEKIVTIPDQELAAWNSWYYQKKCSDPNFESEFQEAIRRARTYDELVEETEIAAAFRGATDSCIEELEAVVLDDDSAASDLNCPICLEELLKGSKGIRLPCSHIFHGDCIVKWLKDSHMCPLCRFPMLN